MQERFSKVEKSNPLNTSANSAISGGKKSHAIRKVLFQSKCTLKSNMDGIRGIHFVPQTNALVSASEDCTLKVWDVNKFCSLKDIEGVINFEPYLTIRGHLSPIMSMCGSDLLTNPSIESLIITGSNSGVIKMWKIPQVTSVDSYGPNSD